MEIVRQCLPYFLKNEYYYWYTGRKKVALIGWGVGALLSLFFFYSQWGSWGVFLAPLFLMAHWVQILLSLFALFFLPHIPIVSGMVESTLASFLITAISAWFWQRLILTFIACYLSPLPDLPGEQ
jgi:hypothetical protein